MTGSPDDLSEHLVSDDIRPDKDIQHYRKCRREKIIPNIQQMSFSPSELQNDFQAVKNPSKGHNRFSFTKLNREPEQDDTTDGKVRALKTPLGKILTLTAVLWTTLFIILCCPAVEGYKEPRYPEPKFLPRLLNVTVREGAKARLHCAVHFLGTRQVTWRKVGGEHFLSVGDFKWVKDPNIDLEVVELTPEVTEWNILILNASQNDSGVYQCQISSTQMLTRLIRLNVVGPPLPKEEPRPVISVTGKDYVEQGQPIHLFCNTTGPDHTHLKVDWFRDGDSIDYANYGHVYITNYNLVETKELVSELYIDRSKASDSGTYICRSATEHIASLKVTVLFADTTNVKRDNPNEESSSTSIIPACLPIYFIVVIIVHLISSSSKIDDMLTMYPVTCMAQTFIRTRFSWVSHRTSSFSSLSLPIYISQSIHSIIIMPVLEAFTPWLSHSCSVVSSSHILSSMSPTEAQQSLSSSTSSSSSSSFPTSSSSRSISMSSSNSTPSSLVSSFPPSTVPLTLQSLPTLTALTHPFHRCYYLHNHRKNSCTHPLTC